MEQICLIANPKKETDSPKQEHEEKKESQAENKIEETKKEDLSFQQQQAKIKGNILMRRDEYRRKLKVFERNRLKSFPVNLKS